MKTTLSPLGRPRAFNTDQALDQAMHLFWRKGFLGTSLSDLTEAMGINRPSLYAAFGNKEALFRRAVERYFQGPAAYLQDALREPTARAVVEHLLHGVVDLVTDPKLPRTCLWVHGSSERRVRLICARGSSVPLPREIFPMAAMPTRSRVSCKQLTLV
jgi:AcrR family transcriptional regulator